MAGGPIMAGVRPPEIFQLCMVCGSNVSSFKVQSTFETVNEALTSV